MMEEEYRQAWERVQEQKRQAIAQAGITEAEFEAHKDAMRAGAAAEKEYKERNSQNDDLPPLEDVDVSWLEAEKDDEGLKGAAAGVHSGHDHGLPLLDEVNLNELASEAKESVQSIHPINTSIEEIDRNKIKSQNNVQVLEKTEEMTANVRDTKVPAPAHDLMTSPSVIAGIQRTPCTDMDSLD